MQKGDNLYNDKIYFTHLQIFNLKNITKYATIEQICQSEHINHTNDIAPELTGFAHVCHQKVGARY